MATIQLFGSLQVLADNQASIDLDVSNLRQLLVTLPQIYPAFAEALAEGITVSIDGKLYNDGWFTPIHNNSEVVILPRITGG